MVRIEFSESNPRYAFQQNRRNGGVEDLEGSYFYFLSQTIWCDLLIKEIPVETSDLRLRLTFEKRTDDHISQRYSKAGFFIPHHDRSKADLKSNIGIYDHELAHEQPRAVLIPIDNWKFGNEPVVKLKIPQEHKPFTPLIPVKLGIVIASSPLVDENYVVDLRVHVDAKKNNQPWIKEVTSEKISFHFDDADDWSLDEELEHIEGLEAYNPSGHGNSIHPKQTMTIDAFLSELDQREQNVTVAYIGTDTIENITSLLRAIDASGSKGKISEFDVYITPEWDEPILQRIKGSMDLISSIIPRTRFIRMAMSEDNPHRFNFFLLDKPNEIIEISPRDITIATYVAPWASGKNDSKARFLDLLRNLIGETDSCLLSIDPKSTKDIVRGGKVYEFSIMGDYKAINLVNVPTTLTYDVNNSSVRVTKFEKSKGV